MKAPRLRLLVGWRCRVVIGDILRITHADAFFFLIDAAYSLGIGILLGDVLGIGLALVQKQFGLVRLPIESYYVDKVPVDLSAGPIVALNIGVLLVCVLALVVPSMMVSRIAPAKAIRFE